MIEVFSIALALPSIPTIIAFVLCLYRIVRLEHKTQELARRIDRHHPTPKRENNASG